LGQDRVVLCEVSPGGVTRRLAGHAIDGNERLALAATIAFYGVNGRRLTLTNDEAYELIMNIAEGKLDSVDDIAAVLATATRPRQ
jgi:death on curing protein